MATVTQWFPSAVKPAHVGWYEVRCKSTPRFGSNPRTGSVKGMRYWDGIDWRFGPKLLVTNFGAISWLTDEWRGLAGKPA